MGTAWLSPEPLVFAPASPPAREFDDVLLSRRSSRILEAASMQEVAAAVRHALKADFVGTGIIAGRKRKRVVSAGALHPVRCAIIGATDSVVVYDDELDGFLSVHCREPRGLSSFRKKQATVLPEARGHILVLMADVATVSTVYENPLSLIWRDAGAVLQTLALVSEAYGLSFCPSGILGQEVPDALLPAGHPYLGVGVAAIGRPHVGGSETHNAS